MRERTVNVLFEVIKINFDEGVSRDDGNAVVLHRCADLSANEHFGKDGLRSWCVAPGKTRIAARANHVAVVAMTYGRLTCGGLNLSSSSYGVGFSSAHIWGPSPVGFTAATPNR